MLLDFLNFLGVSGGATAKKRPIINTKKTAEEFIVEMQSPYFQEEITTETVIKDDKKIEIKKIKTSEPINNNKALISIKTYEKDITRM
ncbi:hypothetical protein [uncultured Campylobacter sp.]|uniref:hypothetical protein n=1 Tax=uncultured Campylobacter sp. TaxID=218934 RepID=UPI00260AE00B|nr:hypothetical protein [uncultured Campylobacter sp.]